MSTKLNIDAINDGSLPLSKLTEGVLPLSGGTLTGDITFNGSANIIRPNSIQFTDDEMDGYIGMEEYGMLIEVDNTISLNSAIVSCKGVVNGNEGFFDLSDARFKDFHSNVEVDFDEISKLPKKYFTWKDDENKKSHIGTSAQAIQELYPELVNESNGKLSVDYAKLSIIALAAIDKLNERLSRIENILNKE